MKNLLLAPLLFGLAPQVNAVDTCMFVSQYQPDITIEISTKYLSYGSGFMKYRGTSLFVFETGVMNGYDGQYFSIGTVPKSNTDQNEKVVSGAVVTVVGDQMGVKGTPENKRNKGTSKLFFPNFGLNYYYSLAGYGAKPDSQYEGKTEKINTILRAAEGFWIPSEICKKYVYFGWD